MLLRIDFRKCLKAGECYYNHPELFQMGEEGFPLVLQRKPFSPAQVKGAAEAIEVCPGRAISFADD